MESRPSTAMDSVETLLKEYRTLVKYAVLLFAAYIVRCLFQYLYNRSIREKTNSLSPVAELNNYDKYSKNVESEKHIPFTLPRYEVDEMRTRARQFYEQANKRRSCRYFSSDPVPRDVVEQCILALGTSPSGAHTEPWKLVVVYSMEEKLAIRQIVEEEEKVNYERRMGRDWVQDLAKFGTNCVKEYISEADCIILVFKEPFHYKDGVKNNNWYYECSVSISVGILLCALNNVGLVTVTSTPMNSGPAIRRLLNRPSHEKLAFLLPVGYPSTTATVPDLKRKSLSEICTFI